MTKTEKAILKAMAGGCSLTMPTTLGKLKAVKALFVAGIIDVEYISNNDTHYLGFRGLCECKGYACGWILIHKAILKARTGNVASIQDVIDVFGLGYKDDACYTELNPNRVHN